MSRNRKLIKSISTVALTGVVATTALTNLTSCGKTKASKEESVVITLAGEEAVTGEDCLTTSWLPLSEKSDNPTFREAFNTLTHNRTSQNGLEGTIYYTSNPTLQTSLKNTAFTNLFDSLDTTTLLSLTSDLYLDIDETTSPDIIKAAIINTYFNLFNTKQSQSQNEFNASQRISRVDFITAVVKSTISPSSSESSLSENDIMQKLVDKSYLGNNNTNNVETGIITKAEAAYMICNTLFNNEMKEAKNSKPAENLQACLENGELSSDLKESMEILESKGIISSESFVANWNKAINKSEAVDLIYKSLEVSGLASSEAVNEDVIADEIAEAEAKLAEKKESAKIMIGGYSRIDLLAYNEKIEAAESIEEVDEIVSEAGSEESSAIEAEKKAAEEAAAAARNNNSNSGTTGRRQVGMSTSGGSTTSSGGTTSDSGASSGKTNSRNWGSGKGTVEGRGNGDGGMNIK